MFENVVLAQKFADRVSSASISKTVRTFAYRAKFQIRIFSKIFSRFGWLDAGFGFKILVNVKPVNGRARILRIYFVFLFLFMSFVPLQIFIRQFNCLIMVMIHHQSLTSRFNKRMTHQMTHK